MPGYNGIVDHGCRVDGCRDNDTRSKFYGFDCDDHHYDDDDD